jgi:chromosomal replication initiation ATPase DnaA
MERVEYFSKVMRVVAELMEVSESDILGKSREYEVVDARWMVIFLMREKGYTTKQVASLIKHPIRTINHALNSFSVRVKSSYSGLGNTLAIARQQLGNIQ